MNRLLKSLGYALEGIYSVYKTEANMRIHALATLLTIALGFILDIERWEWCVILLCILIVSVLEILNTVIEKYLDFYHPAYSKEVKFLKDTAAGAVLFAAIFAVILGSIIFLPKLIINC